jgi:hypothetical protein
MLRFGNAAVMAKVAGAPASYEVAWFTFDNASGATTPIGRRSAAAKSGRRAGRPPDWPGIVRSRGHQGDRPFPRVVGHPGPGVLPP